MFQSKITLLLIASLMSSHILAAEVNLYSARKERLIKPLLDKFTQKTNIRVNLVTGKADALLKRLQTEGRNSPADLFITTDAGRLHRAKIAGVLQAVDSLILKHSISANLRDPDNTWFALSKRARPIFYVKGKVSPKELSTYENLAHPKWQQKICIRSSNNIYNQSLVASMLKANGAEEVEKWAKDFVHNFATKPKGGDRDQIKAAAAGLCDIAIANTYYFAQMITGNNQAQQLAASKMAVFWPNQNGRGAHINISGIALTKYAKNRASAIKLMEFLISPEAQKWYAEVNYEYPVLSQVKAHEILQSWGDFKSDELNLYELGKNNSEAVKIMDRAGWK